MSTPTAFAHPDGPFINRSSVRLDDDAPQVAVPAAVRAQEADFSITGEDISSLLTFVLVGLLALITFGAMLSPR